MKLTTVRLGELEVEEEQLVHFRQGLPGFENLRKFIVVQPDEQIPFSFLQSVEDGGTSFIVVDPFLFYPDYTFELSEGAKTELEIRQEQDVKVLAIVSVRDQLDTATINLQAPVIINVTKKLGSQVILHDTVYKPRHPLIQSQNDERNEEG